MSHFLDRLRFFDKVKETFSNGHGIVTNEDRNWEDAYRNRWRHDKVVRSTHGVNCTGGCSWKIFVKNGLVSFEMQQTDYPRTREDLPNHEPRGCQRGASFSWYLYSPHRIKYPMIRGRLLDLYRAERKAGRDPVEAWEAIQKDPAKREKYVHVRGLGGFVRTNWDEVTEIVAAANVYTIKKWGPDRIYGFSPIPAMSMISYAAGARYLSLIGGACGSFYDWYCDLPAASPQTWGEQTDVPEAADWYNSTYLIITGANLPMTRTPDAHFATEVRYKGTKIVSMAPDYAEYVKFADLWMPVKQGTDAAAFLAMGHVALKEFLVEKQDPYFTEYARKYTDLPMQVVLRKHGEGYVSDRNLRASDFDNNLGEANNPEWKTIVFDKKSGRFIAPNGSIGFRWGEDGKWNLLEKAGADQAGTEAELTCIGSQDEVVSVGFPHFVQGEPALLYRNVPARRLKLANGEEAFVTSVFDMQVAQYGIDRGLGGGNVASSYDDANVAYTPAWAAKQTGVKAADLERTGREFAENASKTKGKSMVIMGAAINHWYHNDLAYRSIMNLLHMCGCVGQTGGGWAHYVGQEKLRPAGRLGADRVRARLAASAAPYELDLVLVLPHRPVALRDGGRRLAAVAGGSVPQQGFVAGRLQRQGGAHGLAAVRPALQPQPDRAGRGGRPCRCDRRGERVEVRGRPAQVGRARRVLRRPGRRGELAAQPDRVACQPDRLVGQGPRVLPQAPAGRAERRDAGRWRGQQLQGSEVARARPHRQARPDGGHQLPPQLDRRLLRHHPADRDVVREERPQHHRHAPLHPPAG